ncbi:hypothetical protein Haur_5134 (plasmid) [Herpetosiphon aurantiacus DSM 785]|uniref:Uncharacterized protein n=1 Tax=Herpetosiphon aurantiacus (strain ATCC 23779 / DSM 785 / 114-95) TaxID=316274 RepID=A9B8U8_HERA2|nr:hypothetical protein Haur_5134 [Herpetosiphon aurantiacus DSM 785]
MTTPSFLAISIPAGQTDMQTMVYDELTKFGELYPEPPQFNVETLNLILEATKHAVEIAGGVAVALESIRRLREATQSKNIPEIQIGKEDGRQYPLSEVDEALLRELLDLPQTDTDA